MSEPRLKLAPPWITYVNKIQALFGNDPDINVVYDNDEIEIRLYVEGEDKAAALAELLPVVKPIGNVNLYITIIPANSDQSIDELGLGKVSKKELFDIAFDRNPVYAFSREIIGLFNNPITYVVFKNRVVQFFNDNLNDIHGLISTLYQDIAEEIFADANLQGVFYNTDIEEKVGKPLGEWP